jgi:hypothetical protein
MNADIASRRRAARVGAPGAHHESSSANATPGCLGRRRPELARAGAGVAVQRDHPHVREAGGEHAGRAVAGSVVDNDRRRWIDVALQLARRARQTVAPVTGGGHNGHLGHEPFMTLVRGQTVGEVPPVGAEAEVAPRGGADGVTATVTHGADGPLMLR